MNETMQNFLSVLRSALRGERTGLELPAQQWQELFHMAGIHSVLPMFYEAAAGQIADQPWTAALRQQVRLQVAMQTMRTSDFLELDHRLREAGIPALVVKGIVCRNLYPHPDQRQSADEDLLVPPQYFDACHQVLTGFGLQTVTEDAQQSDSYEISYRMAGAPLHIELHKSLFPPQSDAYGDLNRFFDGVFDRAVTEDIQGAPIRTMGYTDHLLYLICHAFKHFLHSGFGIRQVCDIILYANRYGRRVDWEAVLDRCKAIRAHKFAAAIFRIGSRYLVFDPEEAGYPAAWRAIRVDETAMLEDILSAGVYGDAAMSRKHSSSITLDAVAAGKQGRQARGAIRTSVFPSARQLEGRYPWLKKHPYLLPAAWCDRLLKYSRETAATRDNSAAEALKIGAERVELMRQYGILK